ncbi:MULTISPECIES: class I SAM-dependent methyltransferase [unclassified Micromonospora]|uniref:O-methyltransferase n=1 Tax=unclassified Micromonospora TaxID=2617518 RepID=UPI0022B60F3D|nr:MULTISPECIES: class I SAM-dependent methyltransferase [unclassified Micromonospora]MCZ7422230.1 class I SAM-dependent methyltransferase [Verrucosispora sp. WMMA2121]WBB89992.1 class I SAM-dependent methyltransferase [Verrucosispora sp. WMMC514]
MTFHTEVPARVRRALARASELGFPGVCEDPVGPLLATLAAAVPPDGRILELGTGTGVGTAWLAEGLGQRGDARLETVELDESLAAAVRADDWPPYVTVHTGDAETLLPTLGRFDLVFADAVAGKWTGLDLTIDALAPGGLLVVDDMELARYTDPRHRAAVLRVERTLAEDPRLVVARISAGTGLIIGTRRPDHRPSRSRYS